MSTATREQARTVAPQHFVTPPTDAQVVWYLGPQRRWINVLTITTFGFTAASMANFTLVSPWLLPLLIPLAINVIGVALSLFSGLNRRLDKPATHFALIREWAASTPVSAHPSVDVLLPSCGEDLAVLRNTFTYVSQMQWAGVLSFWVLDDAAKSEVADLAAEFGFHYRVRPNRGYLNKAGNLQYGLGETEGDLIVIFDADFCPRSDFLAHTVPYMQDEQIAILQTPQFFETEGAMTWLERTAGSTQELFYRWVQPSRDRIGAAVCVGTCAVYRRAALNKTGGFAQIEHSEDLHTGVMLIRAGYTIRYVPIIVSQGLCPSDLSGFINQQYRWCNGSISVLRGGQPATHSLSLQQKMAQWCGLFYFVSTAINVFLYHVPGIIMVLFFAADVREYSFIPFLGGTWIYLVVMPRFSMAKWRFEVLRVQMAYSFAHAVSIAHMLTGRTKGWVATGAGGKTSSLSRTVALTGTITIISTLGLASGGMAYDISIYGWHQFWPLAIFLILYAYLGLPLVKEFAAILKTPPAKPAIVINT